MFKHCTKHVTYNLVATDMYEHLTLGRISMPFNLPTISSKVENCDFSLAYGKMESLRN